MAHHQSMYKESNKNLLSASQYNINNREMRNANRAKQRRDLINNTRQIAASPSSSPTRAEFEQCASATSTPATAEFKKNNCANAQELKQSPQKENATPAIEENAAAAAPDSYAARIVHAALAADNEKLTRQEIYLKKYLAFKDEKKHKQVEIKKPPFVAAGKASKNHGSFAPINHKFKAPAGLKQPQLPKQQDFAQNKRKSLYTVVPTPPRKNNEVMQLTKKPINTLRHFAFATTTPTSYKSSALVASKAQGAKIKTPAAAPATIVSKTPAAVSKSSAALSKATTAAVAKFSKAPTHAGTKTPAAASKATVSKTTTAKAPAAATSKTTTAAASKAPVAAASKAPAAAASKAPATTASALKPPAAARKKPTAVTTKMPIAAARSSARLQKKKNEAATTSNAAGAIAKVRTQQQQQQKATNIETKNAKLAVLLKTKKTKEFNPLTRKNAMQAVAELTAGRRLSSQAAASNSPQILALVQPIHGVYTSTQSKSAAENKKSKDLAQICKEISPVESFHTTVLDAAAPPPSHAHKSSHHGSSAKRTLIMNADEMLNKSKKTKKSKRKFNFVRNSSICFSELDSSGAEAAAALNDEDDVTVVATKTQAVEKAQAAAGNVTPDRKLDNNDKPINYMSPFVSVSRGKVSQRKEKEKRNSIYLTTPTPPMQTAKCADATHEENDTLVPAANNSVEDAKEIELRRTLEAVRYFRKQLLDEIERLNLKCDEWQAYKLANEQQLKESNGEDMIDVAVGQTRLLISKKFQQFNGLIERCEAGAKGTAAPSDGSEKTKPISDVDLDGFWSMLGLQVENLSKRFENLNRWKANNWLDPDEKPKVVTKKSKAKPATVTAAAGKSQGKSAIQQMMQEMRKKKAAAAAEAAKSAESPKATATQPQLTITQATPTLSNPPENGTPTSTKQRKSIAGRRISMIVRDRKSFSPVATIVSIPQNAKHGRTRPKREHHMLGGAANVSAADDNSLLKTALENRRRSRNAQPHVPPATVFRSPSPPREPLATTSNQFVVKSARKSILKTPGTAQRHRKSVIFNEQLSIRKFKFTFNDDDDEDAAAEEHVEDYAENFALKPRQLLLEQQPTKQSKEHDAAPATEAAAAATPVHHHSRRQRARRC